jgi:hypothetical protein
MLFDKDYSDTIKINNKKIVSIKIKDFIKEKIIIPNEQRLCDKAKIKEISEYQNSIYKKTGDYNYLGLINIHCFNKNNYLVDGQHRYFSLSRLLNKDRYINIELVKVDSYEELVENYKIINKNTELPEFPDNIDKTIPEEVSMYFFNKYNVWSNAKRPKRPNLNKNNFQEAVGILVEKSKEKSVEKIINLIEKKNSELKSKKFIEFRGVSKMSNPDVIENKCKLTECYLGMYTYESEYGYQWIRDILNKKESKIYKKENIPKKIKEDVWKKYVGNVMEGYCYCCRDNKILATSYSCGHVKSEYDGGRIEIKNLRPICKSCNSSMRTINMRDYIEKYYKQNLKYFDKNVCSDVKEKKRSFLGMSL